MTCLHCAKKVPLIRRWSDPQFCCDEHRRAHLEEATHQGLARLLENPVPAKFTALALPATGAGTADGLVHSIGDLRFGRRLHPAVTRPLPGPAIPETPHLAAPRYYHPPLDSAVGCEVALHECSARPFSRQGPVWTFPPRRSYRLAPPSWRQPGSLDLVDDPECQASWWPDEARWSTLPMSLGAEVQLRRPLLPTAGWVAAPAAEAASGWVPPQPAGKFFFTVWPALPAIREEALEVKDVGATWEPPAPAAALACPPAAKAGPTRRRRGEVRLRFPHLAPAASIVKAPAVLSAPDLPSCGPQPILPPEQDGVLPPVPLEPRIPALAPACPSQAPRPPALNQNWPLVREALPVAFPAAANLPADAAHGPVIARFTLTGLRLPVLTGEPDLFLAKPGVIVPEVPPVEGRSRHFEAGGGWLGLPMALPEPAAAPREPVVAAKSGREQAPLPAEPAGLQPFLAPAASGALAAADIPAAPVTSLAAEPAAQEPGEQAGAAAPGLWERLRKSGTRISTLWRQAVRHRRRLAAAVRRARSLPGLPPSAGVPEVLQRAWQATPLYARGIMLVVPLMVPTLFYASLQTAAPPSGTFASIREAIRARATVLIEEEFRSGFGAWSGVPGWQSTWARDQAGAAMPGALAILERSRPLGDYRVEFAAQMEKRGLAFALRAADTQNYHAVQFLMVKPGPLPVVHIVRYPVVNGRAGSRTELPMPLALRPDSLYQVTAHVRGDQFIVSVNGQVVDTWTDPLRPTGGVGFFAEKGMAFRLRWVRVVDKDDFLGWLCSQFSPRTVDSISSR